MAARATIPIDDFEDGVVPTVCASTGEPADHLYRIRLVRYPAWPWLFLLLGPPALIAIPIATHFSRTTAVGYLPFTDAAQARMRLGRRHALQLAGLSAAVSLVLFVNAVGYGQAGLGWAGLATTIATLAWLWRAARPRGSVGGRPEPGDRWVTVKPVSAEFAAACRQQTDARRQARRAAASAARDQSVPDAAF